MSCPVWSRRRLLVSSALMAAAAAVPGPPPGAFADAGPAAEQDSRPAARVNPRPAQTMQGFGASGAWWPNDLVKFDPAVRERVADLLFSPSGIALSAYRYNIGGGGVGVTRPARAPESFMVAPDSYDWDRDPGGRLFLHLAAERDVPILVGFSNSAPVIWTTNGSSCGGTLLAGAEADYARYLADIVLHFRDEGVRLTHLSPMNEPDHSFDSCGQEGMLVPAEQRAALVQAVGRDLAARAPFCRVIADESSRTGEHFLDEAATWLQVPGTSDHLAALALHRYDYPNDLILELAAEFAERLGLPIWSTELCCFDTRTGAFGQQYDPTMTGALMMANLIWQGMTVAGDAAFHWWVACSSEIGADPSGDPQGASRANDQGWNDGLLYYDPNFAENGNQQIYATKRFYGLGNFSRYVRPSDRRHEVSGAPRSLRVLAFSRETAGPPPGPVQPPVQRPPGRLPSTATGPGGSWAVVVVNSARPGSDPTLLRLRLPLEAGRPLANSGAIETSADRDLQPVEPPSVSTSGLLTARVPPQSITTYLLRDYAAP